MGRTEPTFRRVLDRLEVEWQDYRRALRRDEQHAFDTLFQRARAHASASSNAARVDPMEAVMMSVLLELELEVRRLSQDVEALKRTREDASAGRR